MPELPDISVYIEAIAARTRGRKLHQVELRNPFLLRTVEPALGLAEGRVVERLQRIGKRIAIGLEGELWLVLHLMVAGRLTWASEAKPTRAKAVLARFHFEGGTLTLTEAGSKRRASLHAVQGRAALAVLDPGGLEISSATAAEFAARLRLRNHTLKRALTDPRLFSGIGNAYSDEILHAAGLSPIALTHKLGDDEVERLQQACTAVIDSWTARLRRAAGDAFPRKVTAFHPEMAVHGRFGQPCPRCDTAVQRIRYAENELNYCPRCQTAGRLLADRALSRLLKKDWPRTIDELEASDPRLS